MTTTITRPLSMLLTEPIVLFTCAYCALTFRLIYCFVVAIPLIPNTTYGFSTRQQGLSFLGMIIGSQVGTLILVVIERIVYQPRLARNPKLQPEARIYAAMIGSVLLPIGMLWFAFTTHQSIHWICPIFSSAVAMTGASTDYVSSCLYIMDTYGPLYGASANAADF